MCWVALDRALTLTGLLSVPGEQAEVWRRERDAIRAEIERSGYSERAGAYTQAFGSDELDASALMVPIAGFDTGPKARATIEAVAAALTDTHGLVHRYRPTSDVDGIAEPEGAFLLCTFWLSRAYAVMGDLERAGAVFERAAAHANDLGLLAEQADPVTGEALGNFPQAFSHIGLVNAAWAIAEATGLRSPPPAP
jgi:GH15 family glucan-1,4-alpha-glucosidase